MVHLFANLFLSFDIDIILHWLLADMLGHPEDDLGQLRYDKQTGSLVVAHTTSTNTSKHIRYRWSDSSNYTRRMEPEYHIHAPIRYLWWHKPSMCLYCHQHRRKLFCSSTTIYVTNLLALWVLIPSVGPAPAPPPHGVHLPQGGSEKPFHYQYPNCDASFTRKRYLTRHEQTHTGEKPFHCQYPNCDASFNSTWTDTYGRRRRGERTQGSSAPSHR